MNIRLEMGWLRENASHEPFYFGLGFVKLKLRDGSDLHFYSDDFKPNADDEVHSHATTFKSTVLMGELREKRYTVFKTQFGCMVRRYVDCGHVSPDPKPKNAVCDLKLVEKLTHRTGDTYAMPEGVYHAIEPVGDTITHIHDKVYGNLAFVVSHKDKIVTCAYEVGKKDIDPWVFIERMIGDMGYHVRDISKGELGEPSKIFEEIEEFKDALDQGVNIMALVELSDTVGAIKAYLAKYHPSVGLCDLEKMSGVTERAFRNGRR